MNPLLFIEIYSIKTVHFYMHSLFSSPLSIFLSIAADILGQYLNICEYNTLPVQCVHPAMQSVFV
jgi:hypothetical protein